MRYPFIEAHRGQFRVRTMCRVMEVSSSGYYAWRRRGPTRRSLSNGRLLVEIRAVFAEMKRRYGSPRIHRELVARGHRVGRRRVERLMRLDGLQAKPYRRFKTTTDSNHRSPVADNVLARQFEVSVPNARWAADITYIWTREGWLYLAVVMDLYSRKIVGFHMDKRITRDLVVTALETALKVRKPLSGLVHHSDRGSQYASHEYRRLLEQAGCVCSMSRRGNCWDNAPVESFFATLKRELDNQAYFKTREQARRDIFQFIEIWYNRKRRHSTLGYLSPDDYEKTMTTKHSKIAA